MLHINLATLSLLWAIISSMSFSNFLLSMSSRVGIVSWDGSRAVFFTFDACFLPHLYNMQLFELQLPNPLGDVAVTGAFPL